MIVPETGAVPSLDDREVHYQIKKSGIPSSYADMPFGLDWLYLTRFWNLGENGGWSPGSTLQKGRQSTSVGVVVKVTVVRGESSWKAYVGSGPSLYNACLTQVASHGETMTESDARALHPGLADIPYSS